MLSDSTGTTTHSYDLVSRLTGKTDPGSLVQSYAYDAADQRTRLVQPDGGVQTYAYDLSGNVSVHQDALGRLTTFQYDAANRETTTNFNNGVVETTGYDAASQVVQKVDVKGSSTLQRFTFGYDANGNRNSIVDLNGAWTTYSYDAKNRLTQDQPFGVNSHNYTYTYDGVDNRLTSSETGLVVGYSYNVGQELTSSTDGSSYSYGLNGNLEKVTGSGTPVAMQYDFENRLTRHEDGATWAQYAYNGDDQKRTESDASGVTTLIWDGSDYLGEVN